MSIILRSIKGSPLTYNELDGNFVYLSQSYAFLNGPNTFTGTQTIVGNLNVFGSASFSYVTSSITEISSSTFGVTISTPSIRYGLYNVFDSGLTNTTSSVAWDSTNNYWLYQKVTGSVTSSAIFLTGPKSTSGLGSETTLTQYRIPVSNGDQSLSDSLIFSSGSITTISGSIWTTNDIIVGGNVINNVVGYGRILSISGSNPGVILNNSAVSKSYSLGTGIFSQFIINDDTVNAYRFVIESNGWIGLGKSPSDFLDVNGNTIISGSLIVTGNITSTSSYALNANSSSYSIATLSASYARTSSFAQTALTSSNAITASYVLNAVSSSFSTTSISSSYTISSSFSTQAISASTAISASYVLNAVSSSVALTASFLRPLSQSVSLSGSLGIRNNASTTTMFIVGRSGSLYVDLNGVGNNYIDGNASYVRNSAGTSNITVATPSKFTVHVPTELSSSLSMQKADGDKILFITSSVSSSTSTSVVGTTASFDGAIAFEPAGSPTTTWNTDLDIYYSGNSGSGHTNLSPVSHQTSDSAQYSTFTITIDNGITLTPSGSIPNDKYTVWVYASGSINKWFQKTDNDIAALGAPGLTINLNGPDTDGFLESDLISIGFAETPNPNPYANNINVTLISTSSFTSSFVDIKSNDVTITGSLRVTGSSNIVGTQTITGSLVVSGSTVMTNVGSVILSGSTSISGSTTLRGTTVVTGSLIIASGSGDFYIYGNKQGNYGIFQDTTTQSGSANVSQSFKLNITDEAIGVKTTGSLSSSLYFSNGGTYDIQFSGQLYTPTAANVSIWLKKNGVNVPGTTGRLVTANGDYALPAWNYVLTLAAGNTIDLVWQSDQSNTVFQYIAASGNIPAAASVIVTAIQIR